MKIIKILGTGCPKCKQLLVTAETAAREAGVPCQVEKVTDITAIMGYGVMMTPALVIDGQVKTMGKLPTVAEVKAMLV